MRDWFDTPVVIDGVAAAVIAAGMKAVARADGMIHQRELNLIASFEAHVPQDQDSSARLEDPDVRRAYLRSLIMVALADGVVSDEELAVIHTLCADQGISEEQVSEELLEVKRRFLSVFAGVSVFREAVLRVAQDLGLSESEVDALRGEA